MTDNVSAGPDAYGQENGDFQEAAQMLLTLAETQPDLAHSLAKLVTVVATEAARTARFRKALSSALIVPDATTGAQADRRAGEGMAARTKRSARRTPGVLDPFAVYSATGEQGLRVQLTQLSLEELRDIVAEHGMDHDRLAMKWKDAGRVVDRIIEKVTARSAKGSAFRL